MKIEPEEKRLDGKWELHEGRVVADATCERIERLIKNHLEKITADSSGWDTLYRDPQDGRYWERIYLNGELHGGGPPSLIQVEKDAISEKYGLKQPR